MDIHMLPWDVPKPFVSIAYPVYLEGNISHQLSLGSFSLTTVIYVLKHIDLRKTPSLEFGMMIIFAYLPYGLAEGISLSGKWQKHWTAGVDGTLSCLVEEIRSVGSLLVTRDSHNSVKLK